MTHRTEMNASSQGKQSLNNPSQQLHPLEKGENLSLLVREREVLLALTGSAQRTTVARTNKLSLGYQTPPRDVWISTTSGKGKIKMIHCNRIAPKPCWGPAAGSALTVIQYCSGAQHRGQPSGAKLFPTGHFSGQQKPRCHRSGV